ncbi:MAG: HAD-IA family hydrolase [Bacillota bacterium]
MGNAPELKFRGEVFSGRGEAKGFMEIGWVQEQCRNAAGFEPYPGTLNLKVDADTFALIRRTAMSRGKRIIPPGEAQGFCEARLLPLDVNGIGSALIYPMVNDYYSDTIEVIAPVLFKKIPGIKDGTLLESSLPLPQKFSRPAAVVFDLDGTLIDSVDLYYTMLCEGCLRLGVQPPHKDLFIEFMGEGLGFWEGWTAITGNAALEGDRDKLKKRIMDVFEDIWQRRYEQEVSLFPGVRELLLQFRDKGIKIGVVTSSFYIKKMDLFRRAGLEPDELFTAVITRNDTAQKKPHPEPIYRCLEHLAVPAQQCLCVGDSPCDIAAGREAGLFTVGVLTGAGTVQSLCKEGADAVLESVAVLAELTE